MAGTTVDPKAKAKRQKVIAGIGGVLLLGLLAFQVPRTLKMLHPAQSAANSAPASTAPASPSTTPLAPPTLAGSATAGAGATQTAGPAKGGLITDPSTVPPSGVNRLVSFSRFRSKDPFVQQVNQNCGASAGSGCAPKATSTSSSASSSKRASSAATKSAPAAPTATNTAPAKVTTATIMINGVSEDVPVGKAFPAGKPVFSLVSLTRSSAKIAIAGGSLETGAATLTLKLGQSVTLMNTADGSRYQLKLVSAH